jgi:transposase InsO family protein
MQENVGLWKIEEMTHLLGVSRSGYYSFCHRKVSNREQENEKLQKMIETIFLKSRQTYGSPRVHAELKAQGFEVTSESLFSRKILAILSPKLVRITRLKVGPDSSCVRHALAHSRLRAVASTMTLRRDAFPASPVNARLSWALRLALLLQCSPVSSKVAGTW